MTARLTIDQVRVGMRVMCVDPDYNRGLDGGTIYEVAPRKNCDPLDEVGVVGIRGTFLINRFIPAPALPAMTTEFVGVMREMHAKWGDLKKCNLHPVNWRLLRLIETTPGILPPPAPSPPGVTDVQATLQWEWLL